MIVQRVSEALSARIACNQALVSCREIQRYCFIFTFLATWRFVHPGAGRSNSYSLRGSPVGFPSWPSFCRTKPLPKRYSRMIRAFSSAVLSVVLSLISGFNGGS